MEKMYLVYIKCEHDDDSFPKGYTIKAYTNEAEANAYFQGLVDGIWGDVWDNDTDYVGNTYAEVMEQKLFVSTDWLEIGISELRNGMKLELDM